jgi:hypothetical protein
MLENGVWNLRRAPFLFIAREERVFLAPQDQSRSFDPTEPGRVVRRERDSVPVEFCEGRGENPDRPFTGQYRLRISPELHRSASMLSQREGTTLNEWISRSIAEKIERETKKARS